MKKNKRFKFDANFQSWEQSYSKLKLEMNVPLDTDNKLHISALELKRRESSAIRFNHPVYKTGWPVASGIHFFPDAIAITSIEWDTQVHQPNQGPLVSSPPLGLLPQGDFAIVVVSTNYPLTIHFSILKNLGAWQGGLVVAKCGDGTMAPVKKTVVLPNPRATGNDQIDIPFGPNFPVSLFGLHQLTIELWEENPMGAPLPDEYQTGERDETKYKLSSSDWSYVFLNAGCQGDKYGGINFCRFKSFASNPKTILLDHTGTKIAAGQTVTLSWEVQTANLPKTSYGFYGSYGGMYIYNHFVSGSALLNVPAPNAAESSGQIDIKLDGLPVAGITTANNYFLLQPASDSCTQQPIVKIPLVKPKPDPAEIDCTYADYNVRDPYNPEFDLGTPFDLIFVYVNNGGTTSPAVQFIIYMDGIAITETQLSDGPMVPGATLTITWPFDDGLDVAGNHFFQCQVDPNHLISQITTLHNLSPEVGVYVYSI